MVPVIFDKEVEREHRMELCSCKTNVDGVPVLCM